MASDHGKIEETLNIVNAIKKHDAYPKETKVTGRGKKMISSPSNTTIYLMGDFNYPFFYK